MRGASRVARSEAGSGSAPGPERGAAGRGLGVRYAAGFLLAAVLSGAILWGLTSSVTSRLRAASAAGRLFAAERGVAREGAVLYLLVLAAAALVAVSRYQRRRDELGRARNVEAQLALHRLSDTVARVRSEDELFRSALEIVAAGTGTEQWVLYRRKRGPDSLELVASHGIPPRELESLAHAPPPGEPACPGGDAVWRGEGVVCRSGPRCAARFARSGAPSSTPNTSACVPLVSDGETIAVLQGFTRRRSGFGAEELALVRWMAAELAHGLKRRELERRDRILASYMLCTGEMLIAADEAGAVTYANPAAERMLGESDAGLRGRSLDALFRSESAGEDPSFLAGLERNEATAGDFWCVRSDGSRFPVEVTAAAMAPGAGERRERVILARDATERHERERQLRAQHETLEFLNTQLEKANERLLATDRMKNEFIANMSHELRTPLNAVIGFATLLEQDMLASPEERAIFSQSIREAAEHLLRLINDILDLAKMEAGRFDLELEPGDLGAVVRAAAATVEHQARRKHLALHLEVPEEPLPILLDPARMRQVLLNLLGNAVKFTDTGEVRIRAFQEAGAGRAVVAIEDTGIGIASEKQAALFQKFSQVDGSYRRRHQGAGLGLTITRSLVERMEGAITLTSEGLGKGTRVTLTFPALPGSAVSDGGGGEEETPARQQDPAATRPVASRRP